MKPIWVLFFSALTVFSVNGDSFEDIRECPHGYFYAGDDTPNAELQSYWPIGKTPVYSCYKRIPVEGINDGLEKCYTSAIDSDKMEARIVIFDDADEVDRVFNYVQRLHEHGDDDTDLDEYTFLTSAMFFQDIQEWVFLGTNYTQLKVTDVSGEIPRDNDEQQCLTVNGIIVPDEEEDNTSFTYEWNPVRCNDPVTVLCEIRIETITYAWVPNWLTITLLILTLVLLVTCCMAAMSYKQYKPRTYRGRDQVQNSVSYPVNDEPPKYSDVTGIDTTPTEQGNITKYKNKGKEILAKIYVVKDK